MSSVKVGVGASGQRHLVCGDAYVVDDGFGPWLTSPSNRVMPEQL